MYLLRYEDFLDPDRQNRFSIINNPTDLSDIVDIDKYNTYAYDGFISIEEISGQAIGRLTIEPIEFGKAIFYNDQKT